MSKRRIAWIIALAAVAGAWLFYLAFGESAANWAAAKMGAKLLQATDGKVADPIRFVSGRLREATWILTWAVGLAGLLHATLVWSRSRSRTVRWATLSLALFAALNVACWAGGRTVLFWTLMWKGTGGWQNLAQHEIKRLLVAENPVRPQVALLGSSQVRAQIDEALLNRLANGRWWATDLNYPGNQCFDLAVNWRRLATPKPAVAVCYLSEGSFYDGFESEGLRAFFGVADLPVWWRSGGPAAGVAPAMAYGLLGDLLPLFRMRDTVSQRVLGHDAVALPQAKYDAGLSADLAERARQSAKAYRLNPAVPLQRQALEHLARECEQAGTRLVLVAGQVNPLLQAQLDPRLRPEMLEHLRAIARGHRNVVLLEAPDLPVQVAEDYLDLTHANAATQEKFTRYLAGRLAKLLAERP